MRRLVRPGALVAALLDTLPPEQAEAARMLQKAVQQAAPALEPSVKWGNLTFLLRGRNLMAIALHRQHANLQVFNGAALAGQFPALEGTGHGMRHLRVGYGQPLDLALVAALVQASVAAAQDRPASAAGEDPGAAGSGPG